MHVTTVILDVTKHIFHVLAADASSYVVTRKRLYCSEGSLLLVGRRSYLSGMEACTTSHYWARSYEVLGEGMRDLLGANYRRDSLLRWSVATRSE